MRKKLALLLIAAWLLLFSTSCAQSLAHVDADDLSLTYLLQSEGTEYRAGDTVLLKNTCTNVSGKTFHYVGYGGTSPHGGDKINLRGGDEVRIKATLYCENGDETYILPHYVAPFDSDAPAPTDVPTDCEFLPDDQWISNRKYVIPADAPQGPYHLTLSLYENDVLIFSTSFQNILTVIE